MESNYNRTKPYIPTYKRIAMYCNVPKEYIDVAMRGDECAKAAFVGQLILMKEEGLVGTTDEYLDSLVL
ncbi:hypothetical protein ENUP19_0096G0002 [Entamoeba nuttalli]|uniref:Uncharacterized protein n=1 Tax=Entamoeba nuttalli TaxID=412467 RepID=A0ABQ0DH34_9EUKA